MLFRIVFVLLCIRVSFSAHVTVELDNVECGEISKEILEELLGPSYNPRYMSIDPPIKETTYNGRKRAGGYELDFYVDGTHYEQLTDDPAWMVKNHVTIPDYKRGTRRFKRNIDFYQDWQCDSIIVWKDLGLNYFPRFLRTVECTQSSCFEDRYRCEPKSFNVKILRRKENLCASVQEGVIIGTSGLPKDLKDMWIWEEHPVNFCCDCVAN